MARITGTYDRKIAGGGEIAAFIPSALPPANPPLELDARADGLIEEWKLLSRPLLYLSLFFKRRREDDYRALNRVQTDGDWEGWTAFFLDGVATIAEEATESAHELFALVSHDRGRVLAAAKTSVVALRLFEELPRHPVVTIVGVVKLLKTTKPTAAKAIGLLEAVGVLAETTGRRRDRTFT
jgi:Fic family protein